MNYDKVILITGGLGFIGSNYLNEFVPKYKNYLFVNIDSITKSASEKNIKIANEDNYVFRELDIRNTTELEKIFINLKITDIIHFAAESHVDISIENPSIFIETNILGTHNLLSLALKYNIKRFHQISTDEVYGSLKEGEKTFTSKSNLSPNNPYSASKASADLLVRAYNKTFGLNTVISRSSNNYGPNQDESKLIPKFINCLIRGEKVPLYSKGENIRDWIYVKDNIKAIDLIFHNGISGGIYNIGAGNEMTNLEIVKKLISLTDRTEDYIEYVSDRVGHDFRYGIDAEELYKDLGWKAKTSFSDGIKETFEFYKNEI